MKDHKYIQLQIQGLYDPENNDRTHLAKIADMVDALVRYEERVLLPHLERKLNKEQLETIGNRIQKHHPSPLQDQYEDQFWNIQ